MLLKKNDTAPADCILLDSNEIYNREAVCNIDSYAVTGQANVQKKKASKLTKILNIKHPQKMKFKNYKEKLSGKLEYAQPNQDLESFHGILMIKKDPVTEVLTNENFIPRGSKILAGRVFCLVVYTGMQTKIMLNSNFQKMRHSFYDKIIEKIQLLCIALVLLLASICQMIFVARTKNNSYLFTYDSFLDSNLKIFGQIVLFSQLLPISVYAFNDIMMFVGQFRILKSMRSKGSNQIVKINSQVTLPNIGQIDYIVIDNSFCQGNMSVASLMTRSHKYEIENWNEFVDTLKAKYIDNQMKK